MLAYDCIRPGADVFKQWWYSRRLKILVLVVRFRPWAPYPRKLPYFYSDPFYSENFTGIDSFSVPRISNYSQIFETDLCLAVVVKIDQSLLANAKQYRGIVGGSSDWVCSKRVTRSPQSLTIFSSFSRAGLRVLMPYWSSSS